MPFIDIATSQPSFQNQISTLKDHNLLHGVILGKLKCGKEKGLFSASIQVLRKVNFNGRHLPMRCVLLTRAVSTLEHKHLIPSGDEQKDDHNFLLESNSQDSQSSSKLSNEMDEREKLRRMRISKANKGNVPWNKGRKHSAETLQRIREKTKLAMQDPKVKLKLANLGHAQSEETRAKIGVGVRMGWQRRHEKQMVQETCFLQWQSLIAEASRRGNADEEELQWDSYEILNKQLEQEWLESIEQRKLMSRPKGSKRAPKTPEQRRKISAAISAKWADPGYRERVCSALAKYHGSPVGEKKRPLRRRPTGDVQSVKSNLKKSSEASNCSSTEKRSQERLRLRKSSSPSYKDPLADSKLEMIKNKRAQRMVMETKKIEAMERAKLLIAEAEKAARALEVAALKSPLARASLLETRKLIAEATRSIEAVETGRNAYSKNISYTSESDRQESDYGAEADTKNGDYTSDRKVNGTHVASLGSEESITYDFDKAAMQKLLNEGENAEVIFPPSQPSDLINGMEDPNPRDPQVGYGEVCTPSKYERTSLLNGEKSGGSQSGEAEASSCTTSNTTKKWVCGRLVEVTKSD